MNLACISVFGLIASLGGQEVNRHLFPASTRMVAMIDLESVRKSKLFDEDLKTGFEAMLNTNDQVKKMAQLLEFDPNKQISGFTVCGDAGEGRDRSTLMIIHGKFPFEKYSTTLADLAKKGELTLVTINDLPVYYNHRNRSAAYFAVIDAKTMIASPSKKLIEDAVQGLTDLREPKDELADRLTWERDGVKAVWLGGVFPEEARRGMARVPQLAGFANDLVGYNMMVRFEDSMTARLRLTLKEAASAQLAATTAKSLIELGKLALAAQQQRPELLEMLQKLSITDKEKDVLIEIQLPRKTIETMLADMRKERDRVRARRPDRFGNRRPQKDQPEKASKQ